MIRKSTGYRIFSVFNTIFMILLIVVMVFPYLNVLAKTFNDGADTAMGGITIYPRVFTLQNVKAVLGDSQIVQAFGVSVLRVVLGVLACIVVQFTAAYALLKKELKGRSAIIMFLTIPMFFGGGLIPRYILYSNMGMLNNFLVYILPGAFSLYNMVIIRTYMNTIPASLAESARLDGANELLILLRIILPLSLPIVATIALWSAVSHWNDWNTTLYFITKKPLYTLQYVLVQVLKETERITKMIQQAQLDGLEYNATVNATPESVQAAQIVITTIPIIIVYPFMQKYFIKGVTLGAIKD